MSLNVQQPEDRSIGIWIIFIFFVAFTVWAALFSLEKTVRASGSVMSESRVQIVQAVDGGTISEILVREGDIVAPGDILIRFDQTRVAAQSNEIQARVDALQARVARLRAELTSSAPVFPQDIRNRNQIIELELAVYQRRLQRLLDQTSAQEGLVEIARDEFDIVSDLYDTGDISRSEFLSAQRTLLEAEAQLDTIANEYFETASQELATSETELAQNLQILTERQSVLGDAVLTSYVHGQVKNISLGTLGGVARAGDELMQIVPTGDTLFVQARIRPSDIADVDMGDQVSLRFDAFDPSVYGFVTGSVIFVSGDTITEDAPRGNGENSFYVTHIGLTPGADGQIISSVGKPLELMPGMVVQADIQAGKRTVIEYLLRPIRKTLQNSMTER
jgi:adhesin transport system membrane fusion protein